MNSSKVRVLIIDDSFFMRKLLRDLLSQNSRIEVVGDAKDGSEGLGECARLHPDVATMDYNMPKMNGRQAVEEILKDVIPPPAIIMISAHTTEGAQETLDCLRAGAVDFVTKPSGELSLDIDKVAEEIGTKILAAAGAQIQKFPRLDTSKPVTKARPTPAPPVKLVVIGSSTGGPPVVEEILAKLPSNLPLAVIVGQHMPAGFTKEFAARLDKISALVVSEAKDGEIITAGHCYVSPGGMNTKINNKRFKISLSTSKLTPSIDLLMQAAAKEYRAQGLGIIMTGMGEDGLEGARAIKQFGGQIIAQDLSTAVITSMPEAIISAGLADFILSPIQISQKISAL